MFVGHYGPAFAVRATAPRVPLWVLFLATQLVDVFWAIFVLTGIERVRIVPGFTATNDLDLYYMPFTHSLPATVVWFGLAAVGWRLATRQSWRNGLLVGAAVASHWLLDLPVHKPDLALWDDAWKVGFGLWDLPWTTLLLEGVLLFGGLVLYLRSQRPIARGRRLAFVVFCLAMLGLQASMLFAPPPDSPTQPALMALAAYALLAGVAWWLERGGRAAATA